MAKRTVIAPDEELLVQGKLTITGNVTQVETTQTVNRLESDELVINADSSAGTAKLILNSTSSNATIQYANSQLEISVPISVTGNLTGTFVGNLTGQVSDISNHNTDDLAQGSTNLYFADVLARAALSISNAGGDGSLAYNNTTGVITYTGPSASEVRAHFSAGTGINISSGSISTNDSQIVHDNLSGFVSDEHVAHSSITFSAGAGLTGGGDLSASRTFDVGAGDGITVNADDVAVNSTVVRTSGNQTIAGEKTFTGQINLTADVIPTAANTYNLGSWANHFDQVFANVLHAERLDLDDADLSDIHATFYAGTPTGTIIDTSTAGGLIYEHNDPSSPNPGGYYRVNPGDGLEISSNAVAVDSTVIRTTGNQSLAGTKTFTGAVIVPALTNPSNPSGDAYVAGDGGGSTKAASTAYVEAAIDALVGSAPGTLDTLNEIAAALNDNASIGSQVVTNTNDITTLQNRNLTAGDGLTGGGDLTADRTFNIGEGTGITVNANDIQTNDSQIVHDNLSGFVANEHIDHSSVTLTAGDGLSGGGDITASRSFDVDSTVVRTSGNQSIAGTKTFTGEIIVPSTSATANGAIYYDNSTSEAYIYVGGSAKKITPAVDVGAIEDVGTTGTNIYAGDRVAGNVTYAGIRSIDSGTYTTISEAANVITVDGDISAIRGAFSGTDNGGLGSFSYNSSTGDFLYTGPSNGDVRGLISGTGLISYNNSTGEISTSADNYSSWKFTTPTTGNVDISSDELLTFSAGTGIGISHSGSTITITNTNAADITGVTAGSGLTGGGTTGTVTLNIGAGSGITVNTDNVAVDSTVIRTTGEQTIAGTTQINDLSINGAYSFPTADGSGNQVLTTNGSGTLSFQSVSSVGVTNVQGGAGLTATTTIPGTVTVDAGAGYGITVSADDIEVSNADIRALFSASGDLNYNSTTGVFSFTNDAGDIESVTAGNGLTGGAASGNVTLNVVGGYGITANANDIELANADVRGLFSAGTGISISSGEISASGLSVSEFAESAIQTGSEAFSDSDTVLMTAAAIEDRILSKNYSTTTGTVTQINGGSGLTPASITTTGTLAVGAGNYILVGADDVSVDATSANTAGKVVARDGSGNFAAGVITATATAARYADLAENYVADASYEPGTVLVFGGEHEVTESATLDNPRVAGVVSTDPAHLMNVDCEGEHVVAVALRGRIPCKVVGPVRKGDVLITSSVPGHAEASSQPHFVGASCIVGKAISSKDTEGAGVVEIMV